MPNGPRCRQRGPLERMSGGVLLSHTLASAVPSALEGLASGFGMGPGVSPPLSPPKHYETTQPSEPATLWRLNDPVGVSESYSGCEQPSRANKFDRLWVSPRPVSTSQLHTLRCFHTWPINPMVSWGALTQQRVGDLILEQASRLDAFSGYPSRT